MPGCDEHYTIHRLWNSEVCVPELSMLAESEGKIIGAILYARAKIQTLNEEIETLTFGPLCVEPNIQKRNWQTTTRKINGKSKDVGVWIHIYVWSTYILSKVWF